MVDKNVKLKVDLNEWTTDDVYQWLRSEIGEDAINKEFLFAHEINGRDLIDLTEDNLKYDLKIIKLHDRKVIMRAICNLMKSLLENCNKKKKIQKKMEKINHNLTL